MHATMSRETFESKTSCRLDPGLTPEQEQQARSLGFLHVTGLSCRFPGSKDESPIICGNITWTGRYSENNGKVAFWTEGGCCWVAVAALQTSAFARSISKRGSGCFVPLSNGESLHPHHILQRMVNPLWMPS